MYINIRENGGTESCVLFIPQIIDVSTFNKLEIVAIHNLTYSQTNHVRVCTFKDKIYRTAPEKLQVWFSNSVLNNWQVWEVDGKGKLIATKEEKYPRSLAFVDIVGILFFQCF